MTEGNRSREPENEDASLLERRLLELVLASIGHASFLLRAPSKWFRRSVAEGRRVVREATGERDGR